MSQEPYFLTDYQVHPDYPLLVFLPGMDETGKELMFLQTAGLETAFDVRCFVIPPDELSTWDILAEQVVALTKAELETAPRESVYLCGESFGGCLALKVILKYPQLFDRIVLVNSASSFHRVPWLNFGAVLFPWMPNFFYEISSFTALLFLANFRRVSSTARRLLLQAVSDAPKKTASQRLTIMRDFDIDETQLHQISQPVLLIGSKGDRLLPSVEEAKRLARILPNSRIVILPHSGHACLVEEDVNLLEIMKAENFLDNSEVSFLGDRV